MIILATQKKIIEKPLPITSALTEFCEVFAVFLANLRQKSIMQKENHVFPYVFSLISSNIRSKLYLGTHLGFVLTYIEEFAIPHPYQAGI